MPHFGLIEPALCPFAFTITQVISRFEYSGHDSRQDCAHTVAYPSKVWLNVGSACNTTQYTAKTDLSQLWVYSHDLQDLPQTGRIQPHGILRTEALSLDQDRIRAVVICWDWQH